MLLWQTSNYTRRIADVSMLAANARPAFHGTDEQQSKPETLGYRWRC
jgi:hypothetical protein